MSETAERQGIFITLEGIDGCGKTTQAERLAAALRHAGAEVVSLREPGGTPLGEKVRALLLDPANDEMVPECEMLLLEASRAQLVQQVIRPALARGAAVVCDRFYDSTYAYQHGGRGLGEDLVIRCNEIGSCGVTPTCTVILDLEPERALARATAEGTDRMEGEGLAFQRRIREAFLAIARREPARVEVVDADGTPDEVYERIVAVLADLLPAPQRTEEL